MTSKEIVKEGFAAAQNAAREKQIAEVKEIVIKTLEKLTRIKKEIKELRETEKILELDIDDLKQGKLDLIAERQEKDEKARETSVVVIIKEKEVIREVSPWYWPYQVIWQQPHIPTYYAGTTLGLNGTSNFATIATTAVYNCSTISCSVAKDAVPGSYTVAGNTVNLR